MRCSWRLSPGCADGDAAATPLLILSVLGLVVQDLGFALISRTLPIPMAGWIMQGLVLVIAILLVVMARKAAAAGWLR